MRLTLVLTFTLLFAFLAVAVPASAQPVGPVNQTCLGKPGTAAACFTVAPQGTCLSVGLGLQGAYACAGAQGPVKVCTSMYTALYGYCPTSLVG